MAHYWKVERTIDRGVGFRPRKVRGYSHDEGKVRGEAVLIADFLKKRPEASEITLHRCTKDGRIIPPKGD